MKIVKVSHAFVLLISSFFLFTGLYASDPMDVEEDWYAIGSQGYNFYQEADYDKATECLQEAIDHGEVTFAVTLADICHRDLDKRKRMPQEAAKWYIRAMESDDGEALSYLHSLSPHLLEDASEDQKIQDLVHIWAVRGANYGYELYQEGKYVEAAKLLKKASRGNHPLAQGVYADICLRQLDGKPHSLYEAAMYYLLSALGGDPDSFAYLQSIIPHVSRDHDLESQIKSIMQHWVFNETRNNLKKIRPEQVNNHIMFQHGREINRTTAMKLPYLFERVSFAILSNLAGKPSQLIDDYCIPLKSSESQKKKTTVERKKKTTVDLRSCGAESWVAFNPPRVGFESPFMRSPTWGFSYGPVYYTYFKKLDNLIADGNLMKPTKKVLLLPLYQIILKALHGKTLGYTAKNFTDLSHKDYPWLWVGITYWKEKKGRSFSYTSHTEEDLLRILDDFSEELSSKDIKKILFEIEPKYIWPNNSKSDLNDYYNLKIHEFFTTEFSKKEPIIQEIVNEFYAIIEEIELDASKKEEIEFLRSPFLMFHCRILTLKNVPSSKPFYNALLMAQRYFYNITLKVSFAGDYKQKSKTGKKISCQIEKMSQKGLCHLVS